MRLVARKKVHLLLALLLLVLATVLLDLLLGQLPVATLFLEATAVVAVGSKIYVEECVQLAARLVFIVVFFGVDVTSLKLASETIELSLSLIGIVTRGSGLIRGGGRLLGGLLLLSGCDSIVGIWIPIAVNLRVVDWDGLLDS
jgi:hypothetical protein